MQRLITLACFCSVLLIASDVPGARFQIEAVRDIIGSPSIPAYISATNNHGQFVGARVTTNGEIAFFWDGASYFNLGGFSGTDFGTSARDINDAGQITGDSLTPSGESHAFIWQSATMTDLGALVPGTVWRYGERINASGQIVGSIGSDVAISWTPDGGVKQLPDLSAGGFSDAADVSDSGRIVGTSYGDNEFSAVIWSGDKVFDLDEPPGMTHSFGRAINEHGDVVGSSRRNDSEYVEHATLWRNGLVIDLGDLPGATDHSEAYDINNRGQIVGRSAGEPISDGMMRATLWQAGTISDLNDLIEPNSGWELFSANHINEAGQIAGVGRSPSGHYEGFLLTPVPEPSTYCSAIVVAAILAIARSKWVPRISPQGD